MQSFIRPPLFIAACWIRHSERATQHNSSINNLATWTTDSQVCDYQYDALHHRHQLHVRVGLAHAHILFEPVDLTLSSGITALIGTNGAGKSSLARVLPYLPNFPRLTWEYLSTALPNYYEVEPETEKVEGNDSIPDDMSVQDYLHRTVQSRLKALQDEIDELEQSSSTDDGDVQTVANQLAFLYEQLEALESHVEQNLQVALTELAFGPHIHKPLTALSSGWRYKCELLVSMVTQQPDLLIIDEPSFLDVTSLAWFVQALHDLVEQHGTMVVVISHKEALLESLQPDRLWYINSENHTLTTYHNMNYTEFCEALEASRQHAAKKVANTQAHHDQAQKALQHVKTQLNKRESNFKAATALGVDKRWIRGKNKEAKQKADGAAASKVKQLEKQVASLEALQQQALRERVVPLQIKGARSSGVLAQLDQVSFAYHADDTPVLIDVDARLSATDRILLCGPNGSGKSTLLQLLLGHLEPTAGRLVRQGQALYFPQMALVELVRDHGHATALDYLWQGTDLTETSARQVLGTFGLRGPLALRPVATLSAGQRVRLWLAARQQDITPTLLVLDEISENTDVPTRDSLLELLNSFAGAVVVVSHDHNFCAAFAPTHTWYLQHGWLHIQSHSYS